MKKPLSRLLPSFYLIITFVVLTSCAMNGESSGGQGSNYKDTKAMVLDVLNSSDGQKAIQSSAEKSLDPTMRLLTSSEGHQIQIAVKNILTAANGNKILEKIMTNPKFAGQFAQAIQSSDKQIHKDLMNDPEYQKSLIEVMNNPEFEKIITDVMKNTVFRQQMMNVIQESMQSPLFKLQLLDLLKTVAQEGITPNAESASKKSSNNNASQQKDDGKS